MPSPRRVLLLGGSGQLGTEIRRLWTACEIAAPARSEVDVADRAALTPAFDRYAPQAVVNCAAFHHVERCESEPEKAFAANTLAVNALAELCAQRNAAFITISTDYVFDGMLGRPYDERARPNPINVYGASKYAGELLALRLASRCYVVRTCGVYGLRPSSSKGYTFLDRIVSQARAGEPLRVVADQTVSPTYAADLAQGLLALLDADAPCGVYHMVNEGAVTWHEYASEALRIAGIERTIEPISHRDWQSSVRRPAYSALRNARLHALGMSMPGWREGLAAYLRAKSAERGRTHNVSSGMAKTIGPSATNSVPPSMTGDETENG